jgi:hypothetical protein
MATKEKRKKVKSARARRLTLQNLIAEGEEIWVTNRSGELTGKEAGNIVIQVGSGNMIDTVVIPPGKDPVCLTDQVTPKLLADCMDLFKLVRSEALQLLDPKNAEAYYDSNKSRKTIVEEKINKFIKMKPEDVVVKQASSANVQINPKIGDICLKAKHAALSEHEALERLMEQESVLKLDDYNYLMMNGVYNGVKRWAKDQQNKILKTEMEVLDDNDDPVEAAMSK